MASEKVVEFTETNFEAETANGIVMVDFWAEWCGPCRQLAPVIDGLAEEYDGKVKVGKLNVDQAPGVAQKYGIRGIPTVIMFKDGKPVDTTVGADPRKIKSMVANQVAA